MLNVINVIGILVILHEPIYLFFISVAYHIRSEFPFYIGDLLWAFKIPTDAPFYPGGTITHIGVFLFFLITGIGIIYRKSWSKVALYSGIIVVGIGKLLLMVVKILNIKTSTGIYILEEVLFFLMFYGLVCHRTVVLDQERCKSRHDNPVFQTKAFKIER